MFDGLIKEMADRFALGPNASRLQDALLTLVFEVRKGGVPSLLAEFRRHGHGSLFESWIDHPRSAAISPRLLEEILGSGIGAYLAEHGGLERSLALEAGAAMLPALIGHLTAGGSMPTSLPALASAERKAKHPDTGPSSPAKPVRVDVASDFTPGIGWLKWALLAAVALALAYCVASPLARATPMMTAAYGAP